jgi:hypothetical protein
VLFEKFVFGVRMGSASVDVPSSVRVAVFQELKSVARGGLKAYGARQLAALERICKQNPN